MTKKADTGSMMSSTLESASLCFIVIVNLSLFLLSYQLAYDECHPAEQNSHHCTCHEAAYHSRRPGNDYTDVIRSACEISPKFRHIRERNSPEYLVNQCQHNAKDDACSEQHPEWMYIFTPDRRRNPDENRNENKQ